MNKLSDYLPWGICGLGVLYVGIAIALAQPSERKGQRNMDAFAQLPVYHHGRSMPLDSFARTKLMLISGKERFYIEAKTESGRNDPDAGWHSAAKWLLDVMSGEVVAELKVGSPAAKMQVFRIKEPELRKRLGLEPRDGFYAYDEFADKLSELAKDPKAEALFKDLGIQLINFKHLASGPAATYKVFRIENEEVLSALGLTRRSGYRYAIEEFLPRLGLLWDYFDRVDDRTAAKDLFDHKMLDLAKHLAVYVQIARGIHPLLVPPTREGGDDWRPMISVSRQHPFAQAYDHLFLANLNRDTAAFNSTLDIIVKALKERFPEESKTARFETFFNHFAPFDRSEVLYCAVFLLVCFSWFGYSGPLLRGAFWLCAVAVALHSFALICRIHLTGLPPIINLYASAVFIGWGAVLLSMYIEWIWRNGLALLAGSVVGIVTLIIATRLGSGNDTMEPLVPVLRTRFWLATHVTCIALGYTACFVAGALGLTYIIMGVMTPYLNQERMTALAKAIYGTICFATLLSFTGTVLGGIWADQSWGRFWGWDPKENGALLIVLWNALILHARWGGMIKQRGMAVLAIGGNIVTAWSWFGVNMLGVGLHSYGFMEGAVFWLIAFVFSQLVMMGVGLLPTRVWWSFNVVRPTEVLLPPPEPKLPKDFGKPKKGRRGPEIRPGPAPA